MLINPERLQHANAVLICAANQTARLFAANPGTDGWFRYAPAAWRQDAGMNEVEFTDAKNYLLEVALLKVRHFYQLDEYRLETIRLGLDAAATSGEANYV